MDASELMIGGATSPDGAVWTVNDSDFLKRRSEIAAAIVSVFGVAAQPPLVSSFKTGQQLNDEPPPARPKPPPITPTVTKRRIRFTDE